MPASSFAAALNLLADRFAAQGATRHRRVADTAATLRCGDGPAVGHRFEVDVHPATAAILAALDTYRTVVIAGPVQDRKTYTGVVAPILHQVVSDGRPCLLVMPRKEDCDAVYEDKIRGTLEQSGYGDLLPVVGAGAKRGVPDAITFSSGCKLHLRGAGGANEAQQASITVRLVVVSEADSIALSAKRARRRVEHEGRRKLLLVERRRQAYGAEGRMVIESTVKADRDSLILDLWGEGTAGEVWTPCAHCHGFYQRSWDLVTYADHDDGTAAASARMACPLCGALQTSDQLAVCAERGLVVHRGQRIEAGQVCGALPASATWSIRWTALDSPRRALADLAVEHRAAAIALRERQDTSAMRQFWRDHLTACYPDAAGEAVLSIQPAALATRSAGSGYDRGTVPFPGVLGLGIDIQEREVWWVCVVLADSRIGVVEWGIEYLCHRHEIPTAAARHAALERIRARATAGFPDQHGNLQPVRAGGCDVGGGGWLDQVDAWLKSTRWTWHAMRGDHRDPRGSGQGRQRLPGWYELFRREDGRRLLVADGDAIKARIVQGLHAPVTADNAMLLPRGLAAADDLARHLCGEERQDGAAGPLWVKRGKNDLLDAATYAAALARYATALQAAAPTHQRPSIESIGL